MPCTARFYNPLKLIFEIIETFAANPDLHIFCTIKYLFNIRCHFFPTKITMFVPKRLYFFSVEKLRTFCHRFYIILGIVFYKLKKSIDTAASYVLNYLCLSLDLLFYFSCDCQSLQLYYRSFFFAHSLNPLPTRSASGCLRQNKSKPREL